MRGVDRLAPLAIALVVLTMVVAVGGIMLAEFEPASYNEVDVVNETHTTNLSSTDYEVVTVNKVFQGVEENSEKLYDPFKSSTTLTEGENYTVVSYKDGKFNITNYYEGKTSSQELAFDYTYNEKGTATNIITQGLSALDTFGSFFTVIVVVGIGAVLLMLLQVFRSAGRNGGRAVA